MKRITAIILLFVMLVSLCACGNKTTPTETKNPEPTQEIEENDGQVQGDNQETTDNQESNDKQEETKPQQTQQPSKEPVEPSVQKSEAKTVEELKTMMDSVISGIDPVMMPATDEVTKDSFKYIVGIDYAEGYNAVVYQPQVTSVAFQIVLFSAPSDMDINSLADQMKANADPRKWICVSADTVDTAVNGNVVLFYMLNSEDCPNTEKTITANFSGLKV